MLKTFFAGKSRVQVRGHFACQLVVRSVALYFLASAQVAYAGSYTDAMKKTQYRVSTGDFNGDGQNDILLVAMPKLMAMIPIDDDLAVPLVGPAPSPSFALLSTSFGKYILEVNPGSATLGSSAWKSAAQQVVITGADGEYADTMTIAAGADYQASFKIGMSGSGNLVLISTTPPAIDPTVPPAFSPVYAMSDYLKGLQAFAGCVKAHNGDRLMLWSTAAGNFLKRTDAAGSVLGPSEHTYHGTYVLSMSANKVGSYVVLRQIQDGSYINLVATAYNRDGVQVGKMQVNSLSHKLLSPLGLVTMYGDGSFAVAFQDTLGADNKLFFHRFQADGTPINQFSKNVGGPFFLGGVDSDHQVEGVTVVTLNKRVIDGNGNARYDTYQIRSIWPSNLLTEPAYAMSNVYPQFNGGLGVSPHEAYVLSWASWQQDAAGAGYATYAQLFEGTTGTALRALRVSTTLSAAPTSPKVAMFDNGSFGVTWEEKAAGVSQLKSRLVDAAGKVAGPEQLLTAAPYSFEGDTPFGMCADPSGSFSVAWRHYQAPASSVPTSGVVLRDSAAATMPAIQTVENGQHVADLAAAADSWKYFKVVVPANTARLRISTTSQTTSTIGNADLYVRYAGVPTGASYDSVSASVDNEEGVQVNSPPPGAFYIGVHARTAYEAMRLTVSFE